MALELHALLPSSAPPTRQQWQVAIDGLHLPLTLDPDLDLPRTTGFRPCVVAGHKSGFEVDVDSPVDLLAAYPTLLAHAATASTAISFRWGGDLRECACVMAAAAALVSQWGAVTYYPADDLIYDLEALKRDFHDCIAE
jgi:hypothetical protein